MDIKEELIIAMRAYNEKKIGNYLVISGYKYDLVKLANNLEKYET